MFWFLAPIYTDPDTGRICPGTGSPLEGTSLPGSRVHCYDVAGDQCLVGTEGGGLADWTPQTAQQAKDHYEAFYGVVPTNKQVF